MKECTSRISTRNPGDGRTIYSVHTALGSRPEHACYSLRRGLMIDEDHGDSALMTILANIPTRNARRVMVKVAKDLLRWELLLHS